MQKWEYKALARGRGYKGGFSNDARDWNNKIIEALPSLGENGWELVSVVPRSSLTGESVADSLAMSCGFSNASKNSP